MITSEKQAQILQTRINAIATELGAAFSVNVTPIAGNFVKNSATPIINAIYIPQGSTIVPLKGLNSYYASATFRTACPIAYKDEMDELLLTAISGTETNIGLRGAVSVEEDSDGVAYACVTNCSMPSTSEVTTQPMVGQCVVFEMSVFFQLVEGGILANSTSYGLEVADSTEVAWFTDLDSLTTRARVAQTDNVENKSEMQSVIGQQGLAFTINVPYLTGEPYETLMRDILTGGLNVVYRLTYVDENIGYTAEEPRQYYVVLSEGSIARQAGKVMTMTCKFLVANETVYADEIMAF